MKRFLSLFLFFYACLQVDCSAQLLKNIGIGIGTEGVAFKTYNDKALSYIGRIGLGAGYSLESYDLSLKTSQNLAINFLRSEDYRMYFGLGFDFFYRQNFRANDDVLNALIEFHAPVGIELFPFEKKNLSLAVESTLTFSRSATLTENIRGLIELSYYFNK